MTDVKHPDDARLHTDDHPCETCGQPKEKHPEVEGFHKYVAKGTVNAKPPNSTPDE